MGKHKELLEEARELGYAKHPNGGYTKSYAVPDGNITVVLDRSGRITWRFTLEGTSDSLIHLEEWVETCVQVVQADVDIWVVGGFDED